MKTFPFGRAVYLTALGLLFSAGISYAASTKFEAESGTLGAQLSVGTDGPVTYIFPTVDNPAASPGSVTRVASYSVTFPAAGTYELYARLYVGPGGGADDSFLLANGLGAKSPTTANNWININNLATSGFNTSTDIVTGAGTLGNQVWKWVNISKFTGGVSFVVPADALTQTFQIGSRENGLFFDAFVFGSAGYSFTVADLDAGAAGTPPGPVTATVNFNTAYQQLDGFGGAIVYDCENLVAHPKKQEIYDLLFRDLGVDILRVRNTYGYPDGGLTLNASAQVIAEARKPGNNPKMLIELVPWSPAAYLKSNNDLNNGGTLLGGPSAYIYDAYAQWWSDSIHAWQAKGVNPDFISLQNEPDQTVTYDSMRFAATETATMAGYDKAFEAVANKLDSEFGAARPEMWGPETAGYGTSRNFNNALNARGLTPRVGGFSFHPYSDGSYDNPDAFITSQMLYYTQYGNGTAAPNLMKPLHMTEYVKLNTTPNFDMAWKFAWHIHNFLYRMHVSSFFNWTLFRGPNPAGGGIVTMTSATDYVIRPQYWYLKAYTRYTDKDWWLVDTAVAGNSATSVKVSAFKSPAGDELTLVLLNTLPVPIDVSGVNLTDFTPVISEAYRSSETDKWVSQGSFNASATMNLPALSITTVHLMNGQAAVSRQIQVTRGGFALNRRTGRMVQQVTLKNISDAPVAGPIQLALDSLSSNTTLTNSAGVTANFAPVGSPYAWVSNTELASGASITVALEFTPPASGGITYTPRAIAGATP